MSDKDFMLRAIEIARKGEGKVDPNPLVGAVIVKDGCVIGEGYHECIGGLHAERNALKDAKNKGASVEGATIYVTLEPCCHYGKTPPCTEAIIENNIKKVVIGSRDPNPKVAGKGVKMLRDAGIEVVEDFMREECDTLNDVFFHYITTKTPYVVMKYAMTADGKVATKTGASRWISGEKSREFVQRMRNKYMGIMVGIGTVTIDNPLLTCRLENSRSPVRIICDSKLKIPLESQICKTSKDFKTIVAFADSDKDEGFIKENCGKISELNNIGVEVLNVPGNDGQVDLRKLMKYLGEYGINSILLEGGAELNYSALKSGIVNEADIFIAPKIFGGNAKTPVRGSGIEEPSEAYMLGRISAENIGEDIFARYKVMYTADMKRPIEESTTG